MLRKEALDLLALGAVLGGKKDSLDVLKTIVRSKRGKSLAEAMVFASRGSSDPLYEWFESELGVTLDREPERIIDAIMGEIRETARLELVAMESFESWRDARDKLARRKKP